MEKDKCINNLFHTTILSINNSALLVKCQSKNMLISLKEIIYYNIRDDGFIHIGHKERQNGKTWKKKLSIYGNNNEDVSKNLERKRKWNNKRKRIYTRVYINRTEDRYHT